MELSFIPQRAYFEDEALNYPLGKRILQQLKEMGTEIKMTGSHNRVTGIPGTSPREAFIEAKRTLVVGIRRTLNFQTCKPSAHFQLPLVTSCPGMCEYCYLQTTLGKKPYVRLYVNIDEILEQAGRYIISRLPEVTIFEGAATSDPLPVEPYSGALARTIEFFGTEPQGRFRFVTKFTNVGSLLQLKHGGNTRFRFSINTPLVIDNYEKGTPRLKQRLEAAAKVYGAGYPTGFIIAPVINYCGWQVDYRQLLADLAKSFGTGEGLTLELITHRFTKRAKSAILDISPGTNLPMEEADRRFKFGQFGYGKYIYPSDVMKEIKENMVAMVQESLPRAEIEYFI